MSDCEIVSLKFNTESLGKSLRYAFAHSLSAVLELVQNARRAGATTVWISTEDQGPNSSLTVSDNGCGLKNFQLLLDVANSGWDATVQAEERPYGLGFLAALFAAPHVRVMSNGRQLRLDTADALSAQSFEVHPCESAPPAGVATVITMQGFDCNAFIDKHRDLFLGYPIPVIINGVDAARSHAYNPREFIATEVGHVRLLGHHRARVEDAFVYLQGYCVLRPPYGVVHTESPVVHLDSSKWFGKFPDRNTVVHEEEMRAAVDRALTECCKQRLLGARHALSPEEFASRFHAMAQDLQMLEVFNDIDVLPGAWLKGFAVMPHGTTSLGDLLWPVETSVTRAELETGATVVALLHDGIQPECGEEAAARRWIYAYARGALMLRKCLHKDHWVHRHLAITDDSDVQFIAHGVTKSGKADGRRLRWLDDPTIIVCERVELVAGGVAANIVEPVAEEQEYAIYVPMLEDGPAIVGGEVLQLLASYARNDEFQEADRDWDERAINQMVRELVAASPAERLKLTLEAALRSYTDVWGLRFEVDVASGGTVTVHTVRKVL